MTTHSQQVHHTRHLHPLFIVLMIGFFISLLVILFGNPFTRESGYTSESSREEVSPQEPAEPRFDSKPQERIGPFRYTSEFMKLSFDVPEGFVVEEKINMVNLIKNEYKINIFKIATNYDDGIAYFNDLKVKNNLQPIDTNELFIGSNRMLKINLSTDSNFDLLYLFYKGGYILSVSIENAELMSTTEELLTNLKFM